MPQPGFFDLDERYARLNERDPLVKLHQIIDWEAFREPCLQQAGRNKPFSEAQKRANTRKSKVRVRGVRRAQRFG